VTGSERRGVTVVVPLFDDLPSIEQCLLSLLEHVDTGRDSILVINDCGPAVDAVDELARRLLDGRPGVRYERNPRNLGFVETCNLAAGLADPAHDVLLLNSDTIVEAGFLDELSAVLHAAPHHGIVCPRTNNATIASIPYYRRHPELDRDVSRSRQVHDRLVTDLPRFSVTPVAMGFCFLVRRELIREHGLFDPVFSPGYGEENDFCLRMKALGFSSLIAHRVFVAHLGARSFAGPRGRALRAAHERILTRRHPHYSSAVAAYLNNELDVVDRFADVLVPADDTVRVVVDHGFWRGETALRSAVLTAAERARTSGVSVTVTVPGWAVRRIQRRHPMLHVRRHGPVAELFDVAIVRAASATGDDLATAHRVSPRWLGVAGAESRSTSAPGEAIARYSTAIVASDAPASAVFDAAIAIGRAPIDLELLRDRDSLVTTADGWGPVGGRRPPLRDRVVRQLEWLAPGALEVIRRRRRAQRERAQRADATTT
jgi:GT2 family glycosyltransferase